MCRCLTIQRTGTHQQCLSTLRVNHMNSEGKDSSERCPVLRYKDQEEKAREEIFLCLFYFSFFTFLSTPVHTTPTIIFLQPQKPSQDPQSFFHTFPICVELSCYNPNLANQ